MDYGFGFPCEWVMFSEDSPHLMIRNIVDVSFCFTVVFYLNFEHPLLYMELVKEPGRCLL